MEEKVNITICLGSSCFARGNGNTLELIKKYLDENNLSNKVEFKGKLCACDCSHGPIVYIGNDKYEAVSEINIINIMEQYFLSVKS